MSTNFPTALDSYTPKEDFNDNIGSAEMNNLQDAIEAIEAKIGIGSYDYNLHDAVYNFIFSGQAFWLYENVAPTGWSIESPSDCIVACSGGTGAYAVNGGNVAGTAWATLEAHTHPIAHTHTVTDHRHSWYNPVGGVYGISQIRNSAGAWVNLSAGTTKTSSFSLHYSTANRYGMVMSGGGGDLDFWSKDEGAGVTGGVSTPNSGASNISNHRYPAAVGIIASKD